MNEAKRLLGRKIVRIKGQEGLSWSEIASHLGETPVSTCAACLGHRAVSAGAAQRLGALLGLDHEEVALLQQPPSHGALSVPVPADPVLYRLHEFVSTYGTAWEKVLREECGDGHLAAFDIDVTLEREPTEGGHRVRICLESTFLPSKRR